MINIIVYKFYFRYLFGSRFGYTSVLSFRFQIYIYICMYSLDICKISIQLYFGWFFGSRFVCRGLCVDLVPDQWKSIWLVMLGYFFLNFFFEFFSEYCLWYIDKTMGVCGTECFTCVSPLFIFVQCVIFLRFFFFYDQILCFYFLRVFVVAF